MKCVCEKQGSTLIEVLVSMVIIAVAALGGIALYHNSAELKTIALHKKMASESANSQMEEFRAMAYSDSALNVGVTTSDITVGGLSADVIDGLGMTVTVTDPGLGYKKIQVDIDWEEVSQIERNFNVSLITLKRP